MANNSLSSTIFSGKPRVIRISALLMSSSLYSCTYSNWITFKTAVPHFSDGHSIVKIMYERNDTEFSSAAGQILRNLTFHSATCIEIYACNANVAITKVSAIFVLTQHSNMESKYNHSATFRPR